MSTFNIKLLVLLEIKRIISIKILTQKLTMKKIVDDYSLFFIDKDSRRLKKWRFLWFFIYATFIFNKKESSPLLENSYAIENDSPQFVTYIEDIQGCLKKIGVDISKPIISKYCTEFESDLKILKKDFLPRPKRGIKNNNYFLKTDAQSVRSIIKVLKESLDNDSIFQVFYSTPFQDLITPLLIKEVLARNGSYIERELYLTDWGEEEGQKILDNFKNNYEINYKRAQELFESYPSISKIEAIRDELLNRSYQTDDIESQKSFFSEVRELDNIIDQVKDAQRYITEYERHLKYLDFSYSSFEKRFKKWSDNCDEQYADVDVHKQSIMPRQNLTFYFPVFPSYSIGENEFKVISVKNKDVFSRYPFLKDLRQAIYLHYKDDGYEYWQLIKPIQILISLSIEALELFLDERNKNCIHQNYSSTESPARIRTSDNLMPLAFMVMNSLINQKFVLPEDREIEISIGENPHDPKYTGFLHFLCERGIKISFNISRDFNRRDEKIEDEWPYFYLNFSPNLISIVRGTIVLRLR